MHDLTALFDALRTQAEHLANMLFRPWNAYQLAIVMTLALLAHLLSRLLGPRLHAWMRAREGWPKWRLRVLVILHQRLRVLLFVALIWPLIWIFQDVTYASRSAILSICGMLAFAWVSIAIVTRLISNHELQAVVRLGGWIWATLAILNLADDTERLLSSISFTVDGAQLSAWRVLQAVVILALLLTAARFLARATAASISHATDISPSIQVLAVKTVQISLYGIAFFTGLKVLGVDLTGLAVLSGAIGVGLGFGLQKVVSNLVSGVIILLDKSVKPGDVITIGDTFGWISALGARYVSVVTRDGKEYLIPNEDLITGQVVNWSHSDAFVRLDITFGTAYGDDPHKVRRIAVEAAKSIDRVLASRPPVCHITGFGDSSVDYILRFWIHDPRDGLTNIRGNVFLAIWDAFHANDIHFPFPQREVRVLDGSSLRMDVPAAETGTKPPAPPSDGTTPAPSG